MYALQTVIDVFKNMLWKSSLNTGHFQQKGGWV